LLSFSPSISCAAFSDEFVVSMDVHKPLVRFYDLSGPEPWSPACWCTRFVLNFKGIPYTTTQVPFQDIKPTCKKLFPDMTNVEATVPIIEILGPKYKVLNDSTPIAELLNDTFTEKDGYRDLDGLKDIREHIKGTGQLVRNIFRWVVYDAYENAVSPDDGSREFYKMTREKETACRMAEVTVILGEGEAAILEKLKTCWAGLRERMSKEDGTSERESFLRLYLLE
jgi:glutathione S-transferase